MRMKPAVCMLPLTLSLAFAWGGVCFAQAGLAAAPEGGTAEEAYAPHHELLAAVTVPMSTTGAEVLANNSTSANAEETAGEAAQLGPRESGRAAF